MGAFSLIVVINLLNRYRMNSLTDHGSGGGSSIGDILLYPEAEAYITSFSHKPYTIKDIGSPKWLQYHEYIEKLSQQAVLSATMKTNEFVMELLVEQEKFGVLIADVIGVELWREKVFNSVILKMDSTQFSPKSTLPLYMTLYHEACVLSLLETVLYHSDAMQSAGESGGLLDLCDYCQRQLVFLSTCDGQTDTHNIYDPKLSMQREDETDVQYLGRQATKIRFDSAIKCVSIVRYLTDHLNTLPISVVTRLIRTNEMPLLLVQLVQSAPWVKRDPKSGRVCKLIDQKWEQIPPSDIYKLTNIEGQIWLAIYQFLFSPEANRKYEMTSHTKEQFMKLVGHLNDVVVDQIPALGQLKEFLLRMQMQSFPDQPSSSSSSHPIIEQLPEIRMHLEDANRGKWASIAKYQINNYFSPSEQDLKRLATNFASLYDSEALDIILPGIPKCCVCSSDASKRCSKCKMTWYCTRECQVAHWKEHKSKCASMISAH